MYIGVRSCKCPIEEDTNYIGSGSAIPKHLFEFKEILQTFPTRKEALAHEIELHNQFNVACDPRFHNKAKQTSTGFDVLGVPQTPEHRSRISQALTGRKRTEKECAAMRIGAKKRVHFPMSEETKQKLSKAKLGKKNPRPKCTAEQRIKLYATRANHTLYQWVHKTTGEVIIDSAWGMSNRFSTQVHKKRRNHFNNPVNPRCKEKSYLGWFPHNIPDID